MRFPPHLLDEIRARLPLSTVVGRKVTWDRRKTQSAKGDFWACCPFHQEKTPSFHVDDRRGRYHCFGCGASGDHFRFLTETEGLGFPEAVERLAGEAGVNLPRPDPREAARAAARAGLADVTEMAAQFFQSRLAAPEGRPARDYLARRGLKAETIAEFRIGYAPNERDALKRHLIAKGIDEGLMLEAGLLVRPDDGRSAYDRFRGRVMIPIEDERGRVVAFGGRLLEGGGDGPKYLNSPETPLFHKGSVLFNAHRARPVAHKAGSVIVVEGYLDAISVYEAGIRHVVASLGTALTEEQMQRLWRLAPEPILCLDGDAPGIAAAHRAIDRMLPLLTSGQSFNFCFLPGDEDPDDLVRRGGREAFMAEIARARPLADVLWERETAAADIATPERKAALEARIDALVGQIRDARVARRYRLNYRLLLSNLFWEDARRTTVRGGADKPAAAPSARLAKPDATRMLGMERSVLGLAVGFPDLFEEAIDEIMHIDLAGPLHEPFKRELYRIVRDYDDASVARFYDEIAEGFHFVLRVVHGDRRAPEGERGRALRELLPILRYNPPEDFVRRLFVLLLAYLRLRELEGDIEHDLTRAGDDLTEADMERLRHMKAELHRLQAETHRADQELADEARAIRLAYGETRGVPVLGVA